MSRAALATTLWILCVAVAASIVVSTLQAHAANH